MKFLALALEDRLRVGESGIIGPAAGSDRETSLFVALPPRDVPGKME